MSQRAKRPNRSEDGPVPVKRRKRTTAEEEEAASLAAAAWQPRNDLIKSSIYNRTTTEAPAELFRKDLISAMKLPDSEPLASNEYWVIVDQWKQEWERGVQVPVNPDSLPEPSVTITHCTPAKQHEFKMPKNKYIRITKDENFKVDEHILSNAPAQAEAACSYDLDECDMAWLKILNSERALAGLQPINEDQLERVIERFEVCCWDKIQSMLRNEEGLGIEYDENVICDVCRSPDSEEGNEMVFCDSCNICVHQACYGITKIPDGQWLCCTCNLSKRPECVLCPNNGGAMKCTRSGQKWAHVSCALWIPEVSIGCVEKMEPITKISSIPASRWALICVLCRERVGACIQCSVKTCKTAYHVTCAFKHGLEMRAVIEDENADDGVKLRSYCEKHSKSNNKKEKSVCSGSEDDDCRRKKRKDMTSEEKNQARAARLQEIEAEFYKHVSVKDVSIHLDVDNEALHFIYNYWKLKRKGGHNKPLLPPKSEDVDMLSHKREQADLEKMKMFVQLRQDLERVRNLCYMVSRREKLSRTFFRMREQTFYKQVAVLDVVPPLPNVVVQSVIEANHGPSIYDRLYSHDNAEDHTLDFDMILARIAGIKSTCDSGDEKKIEVNGLFKDIKNNPYKKVYFNGSTKRKCSSSLYGSSLSSASSSDEKPKIKEDNHLHSSSEDEKPSVSTVNNKKKSINTNRKTNINNSKNIERQRKRNSRSKIGSSSEEEIKQENKEWSGQLSRSRLKQVENELGMSGSDSDELMPIRTTNRSDIKTMSFIYSDSDSSDVSIKNDDKSSNATSDSQQNKLRTKAAVKEFSHKPSTSKCPNKISSENKKKNKTEVIKKDIVKKKDYPSDLIVPQRQAAKKATENLKSTNSSRIKEQQIEEHNKLEEKQKPLKSKSKTIKEKDLIKEQLLNKKDNNKHNTCDIFDIDKEIDKTDNQEILAYVPQRQAAKKAAEHIKSGLGKPVTTNTITTTTNATTTNILTSIEQIFDNEKSKKETEINKFNKKDNIVVDNKNKIETETNTKPAKLSERKRMSSSNSSSSSSSTSSSDSSSTSSSDSDEETIQKSRSDNQLSNTPRENIDKKTNAKDWPFLDKDAKPTASSSSSDSSDSSRPSTPTKVTTTSSQSKTNSSSHIITPTRTSEKTAIRKSIDQKKSQSTSQRDEQQIQSRSKGRPTRGRPKSSKSGDRIGNINVRSRDLSDNQSTCIEKEKNKFNRKGKQDIEDEVLNTTEKEINNQSTTKLLSPIGKTTEKKLNETIELNVSNLEKEILERKAGKEGLSKTKSTLDRLFGTCDRKDDKLKVSNKLTKSSKSDKLKSPIKEGKLVLDKNNSIKKSPIHKRKSIDEILTEKLVYKEIENDSKENLNTTKLLETEVNVNNLLDDKLLLNKTTDTYKVTLNNEKSDIHEIKSEKKNVSKQNAVQGFHNRSIFSPQPHTKENDLFDFDNLDDGFGISKDEEIMKGPLTFSFGNTTLYKEDSKEDSARETLNLVEKLRMELSKKSTSCDVDDTISISSSTKNESDRTDLAEQVVPNNINEELNKNDIIKTTDEMPIVNLEMRVDITGSSINKSYENDKNQDYTYLNCEADVPLETDKNIPIQQHHGLTDHSINVQGDERWVPPSETFTNLHSVDSQNYTNDLTNSQHYIQQYSTTTTNQVHHKAQIDLNTLPPQLELRLHDESIKTQSPTIQHDRRISQTPLIDPGSMDCIPSPSPYTDMQHPQAKWADSEVMPNRRSSSSSAASTSSSCSRRNDEEELKIRTDVMMVNHPNLESISFLQSQGLPFPPNSLEQFPTFSETNQFAPVGPVSLFPPPNINTQLPFHSPGPPIFPPPFGAPFPTPHSVIPTLPKSVDETIQYSSTCTATFTSSQHNMALTAAMVNLQSALTKEILEPVEESLLTPSNIEPVVVEEVTQSTVVSNTTPNTNNLSSPSPSIKSNSSIGKKSPSKPTRTSARVTSQQNKSPNKSPGKSPHQENLKQSGGQGRGKNETRRNSIKTNSTRNNQNQLRNRGRGRGRGRTNQLQHNDYDLIGTNTIHNKLVGTVYDLNFDDDISNENMTDLKAMRERRKSLDIHERKLDSYNISKDSTPSPKFSSPTQTSSHKTRSYNTDLSELRPPTPIEDNNSKTETVNIENETNETFTDIVQPLLPGPVDMRTYNSNNFNQSTYNKDNLLQAFASDNTESQVHDDIDEDFEKELHSALTSNDKKHEEETPTPEVGNIKVSLSDSRNQLKVKIKGPIANYSSTVAPLPPPRVDPIVVSNISLNSVTNNVISNSTLSTSSGTSNLRRMRKKELLRQYCYQSMLDSSTCTPGLNSTPTTPSVNRTIITIPKAMASMTSIPTREDYRDYRTGSDDIIDTKQHRKETKSRPGALSRELKQLDLSIDEDGSLDRRRSVGSVNNHNSSTISSNYDSNKRRGRPIRPAQQQSTPKIKIKFGNSIVGSLTKIDDKKDKIKPPKKRLTATISTPSVEDLKRDSMKFRKLVMADFGEEKRKKKDKSEKRKKRKSKQQVQIISSKNENPTKLIIRFGKKTDSESENKRTSVNNENNCSSVVNSESVAPERDKNIEQNKIVQSNNNSLPVNDDNSSGGSSLKVTPIKFKLSRCQEGSGYIMKPTTSQSSNESKTEEIQAVQPGQPSPSSPPISLPEAVHAPTHLPINKDCEVTSEADFVQTLAAISPVLNPRC